jgi:hypothetical protein
VGDEYILIVCIVCLMLVGIIFIIAALPGL